MIVIVICLSAPLQIPTCCDIFGITLYLHLNALENSELYLLHYLTHSEKVFLITFPLQIPSL